MNQIKNDLRLIEEEDKLAEFDLKNNAADLFLI